MRSIGKHTVAYLVAALLTIAVFLAGCGTKAQVQTPAALPTVTQAVPTAAAQVTADTAVPAVTPQPTNMTATPGAALGAATAPAVATASPTVAVAPTATPLPAVTRLKIPAINVDATIEYVGLTSDGAMDVPKKYEDVAWFDLGTPPGTHGNAVIAGHLDSDVAPAIFWRLGDLKPGDHIFVTRADQSQLDFVVSDKQTYAWDKGPIDKIFGPAATANLNLITCGGTFDRRAKNYSNRLVVYTTLAS